MKHWSNSYCSLSEQGGFFLLTVREILDVGKNGIFTEVQLKYKMEHIQCRAWNLGVTS